MKRILNSSNFWNAVVATILITAAAKYLGTEHQSLIMMLAGLFGVRAVATGVQDYNLSNNAPEQFKKEEEDGV